jgi:hypothetical protein
MTTKILFFVPNGCAVYPEMCKQVKFTITDHFGKKHSEVDDTHSFVTVTGCEVTEKDLDAISARIHKGIELLCLVNPESPQLSGRFITLKSEEK